jgi:hypothetical protein
MSLKIASLVSLLLCVGCRGVARRICYATAPHELDSDGDGLSDVDEVRKHKTDPLVADTDGDGLSDGAEVCEHGTSPTKTDTDGDGLTDGDELTTSWFGLSSEGATDPLNKDTDGDGLSDGDEVTVYATDPTSRDSDDDGLSDGEEVAKYATDPTVRDRRSNSGPEKPAPLLSSNVPCSLVRSSRAAIRMVTALATRRRSRSPSACRGAPRRHRRRPRTCV